MDYLNRNWIDKTLMYYGAPLKIIWDSQLPNSYLGLNSAIFKANHIHLRNRLREKLLKLIVHKKYTIFANGLANECLFPCKTSAHPNNVYFEGILDELLETVPPFNYFAEGDKTVRARRFVKAVNQGDVLYGVITQKFDSQINVRGSCSIGKTAQFVANLFIQINIPLTGPRQQTKRSKNLVPGAWVCCEIIEALQLEQRLTASINPTNNRWLSSNRKFGIIQRNAFPVFYKLLQRDTRDSYQDYLKDSVVFNNPYSCDELFIDVGLCAEKHYTIMSGARAKYQPQEYVEDLRHAQASKWAFRSVAEGIEHFKEGRHSEAFQCLNKALNIDPRNVEGLVARGALYANSGSFKKAVEDFETALILNPSHANARKYMGETLVALGRSYEEDNKLEDARKAYQDCLIIIPHHEEAQNSLEFLKNKTKPPLIKPDELTLPALTFTRESGKKLEEPKLIKAKVEKSKDKKSKKKRGKKHKKKYSSSSSSDSSDNDSLESSLDSSDDSDSTSSFDSDVSKRKKKKKDKSRQKSSSPKRVSSSSADYRTEVPPPPPILDEYEMKVRNFLDMTRHEDDYEERVRKFVEETSKYRKNRKADDEKKKKRKKEAKKAKRETRKIKKEKNKEKKHRKEPLLDDEESKKIREALKIFESLPVLDELGSKLSSLYGKDGVPSKYNQGKLHSTSSLVESGQGKWKMVFGKDQKSITTPFAETSTMTMPGSGRTFQPTMIKRPFNADSDDDKNTSKVNSSSPVMLPIPPRSKHRLPTPVPIAKAAPIKSGPVVLDKFGCFRLAQADAEDMRLHEDNMRAQGRRSRSHSRRRSSSSRSRSSRHRMSRSNSYRSRSGSLSRSRSRSRSGDFRRNRFRGGGRGYSDRPYFKHRFETRGGRGRGGRVSRDWEFRPRRDHFRNRGGGNRDRSFDYRRFERRSMSRSISPERPRLAKVMNRSGTFDYNGRGGKKTPNKLSNHRDRSPIEQTQSIEERSSKKTVSKLMDTSAHEQRPSTSQINPKIIIDAAEQVDPPPPGTE